MDKPDVRFVIHYTVPKSLEGLYQESGRAGRDGKRADCILMFNLTDWLKIFSMTQNKREEKSVSDILNYCIDVATCRRKMISKYFDDDWRSSDCKEMCDHCRNSSKIVKTYNIISCLKDIVNLINTASAKEINLTLKKLLDSWFQNGPKNLQLSSTKPSFTKEQAEHIVAFLLSKELLTVRRGYSLVTTLAYIDTNIETPFDSKKFGDQVLMEYAGIIKGLPVYVNSRSATNTENMEFKNTHGNSIPSSSKVDLTVDDSDSSSDVGSKSRSINNKRSKRIESNSSDDGNVSSSSANEEDQKKKKRRID